MYNILIRKGLAFAVLFLFVGTVFATDINKEIFSMNTGTMLYVGGSGPGNYSSIQSALNDANDGDTIFIYDDSSPYNERFTINKQINLIGENRETTIIDGGGSGDVIRITASYVNIKKISVKGSGTSKWQDAGIDSDASHCTLEDCNLIYNGYAGIRLSYADNFDIINCIFHNNVHGIYVRYTSYLDIINCTSFNNSGRGMRINHYCHHVKIINSTTYNNSVGIIFLQGAHDNIVKNCTSYNNVVGITHAHANDGPKPYNNKIEDCTLYNNDYGMRVDRAINNIFVNNTIFQNNIYGIDIKSNSDNNRIYHNTFLDNNINANDASNNNWNDAYPSGGNYWDDYTGTDTDGDGIGEIPYNIPGGYGGFGIDWYPLGYFHPVANANGPYFGSTDTSVFFNGLGSYDPTERNRNNGIVTYEWDFGDGNFGTGMNPNHQYMSIGKFNVTLTVTDNDGLLNNDTTYAIIGYGSPPLIKLKYPKDGEMLKDTVIIEWNAIDSEDGDDLPIYLYICNDGESYYSLTDNPVENTGEYNWHTTTRPDGEYILLIEAVDSDNNVGHDSVSFKIKNHEEPPENNAPVKPNRPTGETEGKIDEEYTFISSTTDIDGDQIYYKWDWDDETSGWLGPYNSGETCEGVYIWDDEGSYDIKVKAKDQYGDESPWSDPLTISMSKKKMFNSFPKIIIWLFERFPFIQSYFPYFFMI